MHPFLADLGVSNRVLAAPMAGGPTTPALVEAAGRAGSLGFLAGGYKSPDDLAAQVGMARASGRAFGVNLFAPNPVPVDPAAYRRYAEAVRVEANRYQVALPADPVEDDDHWQDKVDLLLADPVPLVSFAFGIPAASVIASLRRAGSVVVQTVTSLAEATAAVAAGVDALAVQSPAAGGHYGTLTPGATPVVVSLVELVGQIHHAVDRPLLAAGGLATPAEVAAVCRAGAAAVAVGTMLLLADESGTSPPYRAALTDPSRTETVVTRSFTGRPARGVRNQFIDRFEPQAPLGYPALHHLTSPLRRAATEAGDPERINLWAGTGFRQARPGPAAAVLASLAELV